ncbi:ATP-dependent protease La [Methanolobus tindarius DSM 2278]|uniref:Lon protease n=1 Tax=Methanolobus tindarius DSM 2278 TaxID=1090322 RepID=W9DUX2_METTI|nr:endopeptidase La [Methanolobus tindarius]ETA69435.1 ATP-dependent protease La [Methanolobus tindarius DSM 2278]
MTTQENNTENESIIIRLSEIVVYPESNTKFLADRNAGEILLSKMENEQEATYAVGLTLKEDAKLTEMREDDLYRIGNLLEIESVTPAREGYLISAKSAGRVEVASLYQKEEMFYATYEELPDIADLDENMREFVLRDIKRTIKNIGENFQHSEHFLKPIDDMDSIDQIMGYVTPYLPVAIEEKQALLETLSIRERYLKFFYILVKQKENIQLQMELARKVGEKMNKTHREAMLREQIKVIKEELNETDDPISGEGGYQERIDNSDMPEEIHKKAISEIRKLESAGPQSPEANIIRNYLDLLLDLPWTSGEKKDIDINEARKVLENNHNGLEKVKERIIQHLAVMKLKHEKQGSIILFTGPPGTGKTSLGKSIADALGREYVRVSLGGVKDEAEIRGHRRTYIGAMPGRILQAIKKAGTRNPVFILDEIDKLSSSYSGDPASALLEVLDPEQNNAFSDHYLEVPYDLSEVLFIATANSLSTIPGPLLDRMEIIEISGYTKNEKLAIAKDHLLLDILEEHGLDENMLQIDDKALDGIIDRYTREAGVRGLKKQLARTARFVSEKIVSGKAELPFVVHVDMLKEILGKELIRQDEARKENVPGVVTGLAWTPVGGDILFIEGTFMPGKGKLTLTGQLGDVMKESAQISHSLVKSRLANTANSFDFTESDIHIHVPSGATPKDGPSAGVTLLTALTSLITGKAVDSKLAMTGEVTLSGAVLPVGGIKEKVLAAHRAGIKKVILPHENERDLEDVPEDVRTELEFVPVETIEDVLKEALDIDLQRPMVCYSGQHLHHHGISEI